MDAPVHPGDSAITANAIAALACLALLGAIPPLTMAGGAPVYVAVFPSGGGVSAALFRLGRAGAGWRLLRVLADGPMPVLLVAHEGGAGPMPAALLLPVPAAPACQYSPRRG